MTNLHANEAALTGHYQEQAAQYRQVLALTRSLPASIAQGSSVEESLSRMTSMLDDLHMSESQFSPLRDQWLASRKKPGLDLAQSVNSVKELIVSLIENVSVAEQAAQQAKTQLFPQMSAASKGRKMHAAYTFASQQFADGHVGADDTTEKKT